MVKCFTPKISVSIANNHFSKFPKLPKAMYALIKLSDQLPMTKDYLHMRIIQRANLQIHPKSSKVISASKLWNIRMLRLSPIGNREVQWWLDNQGSTVIKIS